MTFTEEADADLMAISDEGTRGVIVRRAAELRGEPLKLGKPLTGRLKNYLSVRAAGQRYRIVYRVAEQAGQVIVVVIGIRKAGDKRDAYAVAEKRLT
ncbi:type II toxin-antitoxin system RelE/ParE family toxin [Deinococcus sp. YIM 134068]|uniref:type II toxin-antitoxin system RelE family toxin n=1 Tax=Deinococcus lichenicola TaxID=3118910 RepID=UPI002F947197